MMFSLNNFKINNDSSNVKNNQNIQSNIQNPSQLSSFIDGDDSNNSLVKNFFIYRSTNSKDSSNNDGDGLDASKIIYFYPNFISNDVKMSHVGMFEGLIQFTALFTKNFNSLKAIHTKNYIIVSYKAEPEIWTIMTFSRKPSNISDNFIDEAAQETICLCVLKNLYNILRMLHYDINYYIKMNKKNELVDILDDFVPAIVKTINLQTDDIFIRFDGLHYGPVDKTTQISIQLFLTYLKSQYPSIRYSALLYKAYLLYSSFPEHDMLILYSYLVSFNGTLSNTKLTFPPFGRIPTVAAEPGGRSSSYGRSNALTNSCGYIFGSNDQGDSLFVPTMYLFDESVGHLVAFTSEDMLLVLLFDPEISPPANLAVLDGLRRQIMNNETWDFNGLKSHISSEFNRIMKEEDQNRFIYSNFANHAIRTSSKVLSSSKNGKAIKIDKFELKMISRLNKFLWNKNNDNNGRSVRTNVESDTEKLNDVENDKEFYIRQIGIKSLMNGWIIGNNSFSRIFYLLLDDTKSSSSLDMAKDELVKFSNIHFSTIVT